MARLKNLLHTQLAKHLLYKPGTAGGPTFRPLHFIVPTCQNAPGVAERLRTFQVQKGTSYDEFCGDMFEFLDWRLKENTSAGVETSYVMDRVRDHISHKLPLQLHLVFPRDEITASTSVAIRFE